MDDLQFTAFVDQIGEDCSGSQPNLALITATTGFDNIIGLLFPSHVLEDAETSLHRASLSPLLMNLTSKFWTNCKRDVLTPLNAPEHTSNYLVM
ncbi:hypothetical protein DFJ58DRAFT_722458 [Suillus subalutaceus]|uniref:uncharacterized protein n=1 Tax=Suillus subalutaceus TaxID=48586 RepID=UPI001B863B0C|nr:uncharacterized protein DFJ58DRAFT_722458 [Suillus subalutaceus]KAG1871725.1 hypothetical protein DFJ58DRAFT_722458 [Suillus subalutaceus]